MKIGDKVKVTYANGDQHIGRIIGQTEKMWKVDFDGALGEKRVKKGLNVVLVDDPKTPEKEVITTPAAVLEHKKSQEKGLKWRVTLIIIAALAIATVAVLVGFDVITLGAGGFMGQ